MVSAVTRWVSSVAEAHVFFSSGGFCGFWPGGGGADYAAFYSYAYPAPMGFGEFAIKPQAASFSEALGEFLLPYDAVRSAADPDAALLAFLASTYQAAAHCADWDRAALECPQGVPGVARDA